MEQKEYTTYILTRLIECFPEFDSCYHINQNDMGYINYKSKAGKLTLLVSTRAKELTIGFAASPESFYWHVHMDMYGAKTPDDELILAIEAIDEIINDNVNIVYSSALNYFITDDINGIDKYKEKDEVIEIVKWSDL